MLNVLFIGDVNGKIGRQAVAKILPKLKKSQKIDFVFANAENAAHGTGVTEDTLKELMDAGIDYFTNGDHAFDKVKQIDCYEKFPVLRPANYSSDAPGKGYAVIEKGKYKISFTKIHDEQTCKGQNNLKWEKTEKKSNIMHLFQTERRKT